MVIVNILAISTIRIYEDRYTMIYPAYHSLSLISHRVRLSRPSEGSQPANLAPAASALPGPVILDDDLWDDMCIHNVNHRYTYTRTYMHIYIWRIWYIYTYNYIDIKLYIYIWLYMCIAITIVLPLMISHDNFWHQCRCSHYNPYIRLRQHAPSLAQSRHATHPGPHNGCTSVPTCIIGSVMDIRYVRWMVYL